VTVYTDRSRILTYQRCPRRRYYEYHQDGLGIVPKRTALPLAVGGAVHAGLADLLQGEGEDCAVVSALEELAKHQEGLELDLSEAVAQAAPVEDLEAQLHASLGMDDIGRLSRVDTAKSDFDKYLYAEQSALVEAMVRAYARRRLRPLLDQYEVLEVEREGQWELSDGIWFASRPDALLRDRELGYLYIQSFKTAAAWDIRKERDAERDMQGLSECVEAERRLGERISGIRYEYLFKGDRWRDKDLTRKLGIESRVQKSHLVRAYLNSGMTAADAQWCWSYDYHKEDGAASKLYWKTWRPAAVWEHMPIKDWIDMLDATIPVSEEGRDLGFQGPAQSAGYTSTHPLDEVFHPPIVVYRNDDQLRDWLEQTEHQEQSIALDVQAAESAHDAVRRTHMNKFFPQFRQSCCYPTTCPYDKICFGPEHIQRDPLGSGLYKIRTPNHPQEGSVEANTGSGKL